jgi:hypothetical protein
MGGGKDLERDDQFKFTNKTVTVFMTINIPAVSVDCKKKELIGKFKNAGADWFSKGSAARVNAYYFIDIKLGEGSSLWSI